ncbi:hypothetical protein [Cohnella soli]|uniref:Uncharacterized protein n=1 Tax=Cohnella soli TaxID=425005 RepID=A0ABW0HRU1_9BACL
MLKYYIVVVYMHIASGRFASRWLDEVGEAQNMIEEYVWAIFVSEGDGGFPNFFPIGLFSSYERALEELDTLPQDMNYQLLRLPVNRMFPYYHKKSGKLIGMDGIHHEHFHFRDDSGGDL